MVRKAIHKFEMQFEVKLRIVEGEENPDERIVDIEILDAIIEDSVIFRYNKRNKRIFADVVVFLRCRNDNIIKLVRKMRFSSGE